MLKSVTICKIFAAKYIVSFEAQVVHLPENFFFLKNLFGGKNKKNFTHISKYGL